MFTSCSNNRQQEFSFDSRFGELSQIAESCDIPSMQLSYYQRGIDPVTIVCGTDSTKALGKDQVFQAASLGKVVFSYIVMRLVDEGKIDLDTPICKYTDIDRFNDKQMASRMTPRMVLSHTSGLYNWASSPTSQSWKDSKITFHYPVDSCYAYSGEAFAFLQRAVESVSGKTLNEIAKEYVFVPFEMPLSSYEWRPEYDSLAIEGYDRSGADKGRWEGISPNCAYTLRTTSSEFMNFMIKAIMEGTGLSEKTFAAWTSPRSEAIRFAKEPRECDKDMYWGLGIGMRVKPGTEEPLVYWHWGDNDYWKSIFVIDPAKGQALNYFTNSAKGHDICNDVLNLYLGESYSFQEWIGNRDDD